MVGDGAADVLRPENLAEHIIALTDRSRLRCEHRVEQSATAELAEQSAEAAQPTSSRFGARRLFLETAEDRGKQRFGALLPDRGRFAQHDRASWGARGCRSWEPCGA